MVNEPADLAAVITEFAAGNGMTLVPAVPGAEGGRAVLLEAGVLDLPGFLDLARKLGDGALYLRTEVFGLAPEDVPAHLARYKGKACELQVAFASVGHGLLHFWDHTAPWYRDWLDSEETRLLAEDDDDVQGPARQERTRLARELAEVLLADPEFRAATPAARDHRAEQLMPEGTDREVRWDAVSQAAEMAREQSAAAYNAIWGQLDELAAEFAASPGCRKSASQPGRKRAAEEFLASRANGFPAPAGLRDELCGRAQKMLKARGGSALFLRCPGRREAGRPGISPPACLRPVPARGRR
jgi:hypothetical protein